MNYFNYFSEIEETFIRRRGRNLLLSPLDWALIETWQERGIPLRIVLRGIEKVFDSVDKQPARKRTVKSLLYCKEEIEAQYSEWLETQIGKNGDTNGHNSEIKDENSADEKTNLFPDEAINTHLENVSLELKAARNKADGKLRDALEKVAAQLLALRKNSFEAGKLEDVLEKMDALVDESLLQNFETESLKSEIETEIAAYKIKMEPEVYKRTFDLMLLKRLRENSEIPRFSLFYL
jgi:hypothetical protein